MLQPHTPLVDLRHPGKPRDLPRVVIVRAARLHRLPVPEGRLAAVTHHECGGDDRLADVGVRPRHEDSAEHPYRSAPALTSAETSAGTNRSIISPVRLTLMAMRSRAVPGGTLGGRTARTSKPSACIASATATAASLSPMKIGTICEVPAPTGTPAVCSRARSACAVARSCARRCGSVSMTSRLASTAAAMAGG